MTFETKGGIEVNVSTCSTGHSTENEYDVWNITFVFYRTDDIDSDATVNLVSQGISGISLCGPSGTIDLSKTNLDQIEERMGEPDDYFAWEEYCRKTYYSNGYYLGFHGLSPQDEDDFPSDGSFFFFLETFEYGIKLYSDAYENASRVTDN